MQPNPHPPTSARALSISIPWPISTQVASALRARAISKSFEAGVAGCSARVRAVTRVDFDLRPGEIVAIDGSPGSGKSTLLLILAGILPADSGSIQWLTSSGEVMRTPSGVEYLPSWRSGHALQSLRRAIAAAPGILLVDDILANLDSASRAEVRARIRQLALSRTSVVVATRHDRMALQLASRVVRLRNGAADRR